MFKGYLRESSIDGSFGQETFETVKSFQKNNNLNADGIAGPATREKLNSPTAVRANNRIKALTPHSLPTIGNPNSVGIQYGKDGKIARKRYYGPDGKAVKDEDYTAHGGHETPHDHGWDWGASKGKRGAPTPHQEAEEIAKKAAVAAIATAGGYVIYRGVRMLPSLLPPLWWTIPGNVVIP